jgi:hypothetical protein
MRGHHQHQCRRHLQCDEQRLPRDLAFGRLDQPDRLGEVRLGRERVADGLDGLADVGRDHPGAVLSEQDGGRGPGHAPRL